jgi:hypothetical protein
MPFTLSMDDRELGLRCLSIDMSSLFSATVSSGGFISPFRIYREHTKIHLLSYDLLSYDNEQPEALETAVV